MSNISTHFEMLMPLEEQERIGATADRAEHMRVMRVLSHYEQMREALKQARLCMEGNREYCKSRALTHAGIDRCIALADEALN